MTMREWLHGFIGPGVTVAMRLAELYTRNGNEFIVRKMGNERLVQPTEKNPYGVRGLSVGDAYALIHMAGIIAGMELSGNGTFEDARAAIGEEGTREWEMKRS